MYGPIGEGIIIRNIRVPNWDEPEIELVFLPGEGKLLKALTKPSPKQRKRKASGSTRKTSSTRKRVHKQVLLSKRKKDKNRFKPINSKGWSGWNL